MQPPQHPFQHGHIFQSPGSHFTYRVIGPCCRLFDREELPWPCCRLQWRGKEPSWRRVGRRLVVDMASRNSPSYSVEVIGQEYSSVPFVMTLYPVKLPVPLREWWYSKKPQPPTYPPDVNSVNSQTNVPTLDRVSGES